MPAENTWARLTRGHDLFWILSNNGFLGTLRWLRRSLPYYLWLHFTPAGHRERDFDKIHGVETEGILPPWEMGDVGPNLRFAVQYLPTKPKKFYRVLDSLRINYSEFTFIDIGSGKGRALLLASRYPFRNLVGVEFVSKLCETARRNLEIWHCAADVVCADATTYAFPANPLILYIYNPFGAEPMREMVKNLERSLAANPRPVYVIYWNPFYVHVFDESRYFSRISFRQDEFAILRSVERDGAVLLATSGSI